MKRLLAFAATSVLVLASCQSQPATTTSPPPASPTGVFDAAGCISSFDPAKDYFTDKTQFLEAKQVSVEYHKSYKVVTVAQPSPGAPPESYVLVHCGAPEPKLEGNLSKAVKITIPVKRVAAESTTHVPAFELLDQVAALAGVGNAKMLSAGPVKDGVAAGKIANIQSEGMSVSVESVAAIKPDLFMTSGFADPAHTKVAELGIPLLANSDWLETTPLGRAEWMKLPALLLNAESKANSVFDQVRADYQALTEKAAKANKRPTVLAGSLYNGIFYAAGADGYVARFIKDAGADYILAKDAPGTGSAELALEKALGNGANAEVWINASSSGRWANLGEAVKSDARLGQIKAVKEGSVWNYTLTQTPEGGNDYWQMGVARPDLVLGDLVAALHPDVLPGHKFAYYEQVPKG